MSYLSARRSPYPFHLKIGAHGFMLGQTRPGAPQLLSAKAADISSVSPTDYTYAGWNPSNDRVEPYEQLVRGMGLAIQEKWQDQRYLVARGVDLSVWPWCAGPEIVAVTPPVHDVAHGCREFFELGGNLFCAQGRYVLVRSGSDGWSVAHDFGSADSVLDVQVFTSNFDGIERVFVALQSGVAQWSTTGTGAWTAMATFHALAFGVTGREFWWADDTNRLRKCDTNADPTNEANYTALIFRAGDKSSPVTALWTTAGGVLVIAKTDGLYTLDQAGDDHELQPFLRYAEQPYNGRAGGQFESSLYLAYANSFGRLDPDLSWSATGIDQLVENTSEVSGRITAFAGVETMFAWAAVLNPDTQTSYLAKFGAWVIQPVSYRALTIQGELISETIHIDAWHASLSQPFPNLAIQTMFVSSVGAPGGHSRTYLGFSDGTIGWLINPCTPHPAGCTAYRYQTGDLYVDLPLWHGNYHASLKSLHHFGVTAPALDAGRYVTLEYKTDAQATSYRDFGYAFNAPEVYEDHPFPTDASGTLVALRVHLHNTDPTKSPQISAVSLGHALRPLRLMTFEADVLCADGLVRRDGVPLRLGRRKIRELVQAAVDTPGAVLVVLPDESVHQLSFSDYQVSQSFDEVGRQYRASLHIKASDWYPSAI